MDVANLLNALDNDDNESMVDLTYEDIQKEKIEIINELDIPKKTKIEFLKKLKEYRFIEEMDKLKYGIYIRYIPIETPEKLTGGGVVCDVKVTDTGVSLVCKNFKNQFFQVKVDDNILFQKLTSQEKIILDAFKMLS